MGATTYQLTEYYFNDDANFISSPFYYVQAAIFEKVLTDWNASDSVIVFTTQDAFKYNYENRLTDTRKKTVVENDGLHKHLEQLKKLGKIGTVQHREIPDGNNKEEIWQIFQTIFDEIQEKDEVYFDITNGFRSLPMLGMVLIDYAKVLRNITPRAIYYGNFEAGRARKKDSDLYVKAPVIDVTSFTDLQAWTIAAQAFLNGGNAKLLTDLLHPSKPDLAITLSDFTEAILTCRGKRLMYDLPVNELKNLVAVSVDSVFDAQLKPILEKISNQLEHFESQNVKNGFAAVDWCINNGLLQQGYTFLLETVVSYVIEHVFGINKITEFDYRECANAALNGFSNLRIPATHFNSGAVVQQLKHFVNSKRDLSRTYKILTGHNGLRNDINHCGMKQNNASPDNLKDDLNMIFNQIKRILSISF
jgi:CRISPR-associated Csx2 family protein